MRIYKEFRFEAAHYLPSAQEGHPYRRLHGHSFRAVVWLEGEADPDTGLVREFGDVRDQIEQVRLALDHSCLNDVEDLAAPTLECLAVWIWRRLKPQLPQIARVEVHRDSCDEGCVYDGPGGRGVGS